MGRYEELLLEEGIVTALRHELHHFEGRITKMLEDLKAAVAAEHSAVQGAVTLLKGLADKIAALSPNTTAIAELAAQVRKDTADLANATVANTPSAPDAAPVTPESVATPTPTV